MAENKGLFSTIYNPDVLTCLANLSNDEIFTPPDVANAMLDLLPQELFSNPDTKFLDPACKTGIFLREIAKRLLVGLEPQIPDLQERIEHIYHHQLYGIAITELTSLLTRRSVYCSKYPNGEYSISEFDDARGNIIYHQCSHTWVSGKCKYCGTSQVGDLSEKKRGTDLEVHAYEWIHTENPEAIINMKFDVIISNPPYQLSTVGDDNGAQAKPIYQKFMQQATKLKSKFIVMITPSRWFAGGWGLDKYRNMMISCNHIREIHDFQNSTDCFSGVEIKGGVSYFLYDRDYCGQCKFFSHEQDNIISVTDRKLQEDGCDVLIRHNELIGIYRKAQTFKKFVPFSLIVSGRSPFGLNTNHSGNIEKKSATDIIYFERKGYTYMPSTRVARNREFIDKYKIFIPKAAEDGKLPGKIIGSITLGTPGTICSGTYLLVGPFNTEIEMHNAASYMRTKFFRALVAVNKISQDSYSKVYDAVPIQDFTRDWTDEELYSMYNLSQSEINFIENMIKPMD